MNSVENDDCVSVPFRGFASPFSSVLLFSTIGI